MNNQDFSPMAAIRFGAVASLVLWVCLFALIRL